MFSTTELQYTIALGFLYDEQANLAEPAQRSFESLGSRTEPHAIGIHLPKIELPTFSGRLEEWESFRDVFRSMIHLHPALTNVQKLHYLKSSIEGEAKAAISNLPVTEANYGIAWELLSRRYENRQLLFNHHVRQLVRSRPLTGESASGLRELLDRVTSARESLRIMGIPVEHWDALLAFVLVEGMDRWTRKDWEKEKGDCDTLMTYEEVTHFISSRIRAL